MDIIAKKEAAVKMKEGLEKSNEREPKNLQELANDTATIERVIQMRDNGDPLPRGYVSYTEWLEAVDKQVGTSEKSLDRIEDQKLKIEVLDYFIANAV